MRQYTSDFEPVAPHSFDDLWEKKLTSVQQVKGETNQPFKWQYQVLEYLGASGFKLQWSIPLATAEFLFFSECSQNMS